MKDVILSVALWFQRIFRALLGITEPMETTAAVVAGPRLIKQGPAQRVVFFYAGEEGTFVDQPYVTLYENGIVHLRSPLEETTAHLQNCEIVWFNEVEKQASENTNIRMLRPSPRGDLPPTPPSPMS